MCVYILCVCICYDLTRFQMVIRTEHKYWNVMMDQGLGSQRRLNFPSFGLIVIKVVGYGSIAISVHILHSWYREFVIEQRPRQGAS